MISMYNDNGNDSAENIVFLDNFIALKKRIQEYLLSLILFFNHNRNKITIHIVYMKMPNTSIIQIFNDLPRQPCSINQNYQDFFYLFLP